MSGAASFTGPTEDQIFDTVWTFVSELFDASLSSQIVKADQNLTPSLLGTYAVIQPGVKVRQDQGVRSYTLNSGSTTMGLQSVSRGTQYYYQVDCYGPSAPDWADTIAISWRSMWGADFLQSGVDVDGIPLKASIAPLFADEPIQLNIINAEQQVEQRYMLKLYLQANQVTALNQAMFVQAPVVGIEPPVDVSNT